MQKKSLETTNETFTIGSREELDSAYKGFSTSLVCLKLYDASVSLERSIVEVSKKFTVYELALKVFQIQTTNLAFLSTESKQYFETNSFFAQQALCPQLIDDEDLLHMIKILREEIDIRWQVLRNSKDKESLREDQKTQYLKQRMRITFEKSKKLEHAFNCQKFRSLCYEICRFSKYHENRANVVMKEDVAIEDSNSKALVATDNNEDIDWTKEFDAEPVTYAMMAAD
ncbi:hypothetical protein Tco_0928265 [Tanacetum coccineum]